LALPPRCRAVLARDPREAGLAGAPERAHADDGRDAIARRPAFAGADREEQDDEQPLHAQPAAGPARQSRPLTGATLHGTRNEGQRPGTTATCRPTPAWRKQHSGARALDPRRGDPMTRLRERLGVMTLCFGVAVAVALLRLATPGISVQGNLVSSWAPLELLE